MNYLLSFIIVLGVLIFFHEFGHFLVARLFGVGVEKFSLGFGPRMFGKTIGITDYRHVRHSSGRLCQNGR